MKKRNGIMIAGLAGAVVIGGLGGAVAAGIWGTPSIDHSDIRYNVSIGTSGTTSDGTTKGEPILVDLGEDFMISASPRAFEIEVTAEDTDLSTLGILIADGDPNRIVKVTPFPGTEDPYPDIFSQIRFKVTNRDTGVTLIDGERVGRLSDDPTSDDYLKTAEPGVLEGKCLGKISEGTSQTLEVSLWLDPDFGEGDVAAVYNATTTALEIELEGLS
jgi:hypothetical protein